MRKAWAWLGLNLGKRAGTVTAIGLVVTLALGIGISQLHFVTNNNSYLNGNDKAQIDNNKYESLFGGDPIVALFTMAPGKTIDDLFTPANVAEFQRIQDQLHQDSTVFSVITPLDALTLADRISTCTAVDPTVAMAVATGATPNASTCVPTSNPTTSQAANLLISGENRDPSAAGKAARIADITALAGAVGSIPADQRVVTNPAFVQVLLHNRDGSIRSASQTFFPNETHASIVAFVKGGLSIEQESKAATQFEQIFAASHFENVQGGKPLVTGVPALLRTINNYLKHGMATLTIIAAIVMVIILLLLFTVRWRLLPFLIVAVGLIWAFGIAGYAGIPLTLASISGLPVLLGIGIDYAIQLHSRVEEEVVLDRAAHPMQATARNLGPALLVVTFDAVFAFLALTVAKVPMIREFGWLLVVGIIAVCVGSIILPLAILGIREYKSPTKGKDFSKGVLSRFVVWIGSLSAKFAIPFALVSILVFTGGLAVEGKLKLQTDPLQWIAPSDQTVKNLQTLKADTGADNEVGTLIHMSQPFTDQDIAYASSFEAGLQKKYPNELFTGTGLVGIAQSLLDVPGASAVAPTGEQVAAVYALAPPDIQRTAVAEGGAYFSIFFRGKTATLSQLEPVVNCLNSSSCIAALPAPTGPLGTAQGVTITPGGIASVGVGFLDNLNASRTLLTYLSIIFVGLFLTVRLRSLVRAVLSLVPVIVAVGGVALVIYVLNVPLSPMTAVSGPLVVAVCTEFTSLILLRFVEERGRGLDPRQSMAVTASRTGRAFVVSGLTAVSGVAVLATSPWPLLRGFGIVVGLNVLIALFCALIILPPILVWADGMKHPWVSRNLTHSDDTPRDAQAATEGESSLEPEPAGA